MFLLTTLFYPCELIFCQFNRCLCQQKFDRKQHHQVFSVFLFSHVLAGQIGAAYHKNRSKNTQSMKFGTVVENHVLFKIRPGVKSDFGQFGRHLGFSTKMSRNPRWRPYQAKSEWTPGLIFQSTYFTTFVPNFMLCVFFERLFHQSAPLQYRRGPLSVRDMRQNQQQKA